MICKNATYYYDEGSSTCKDCGTDISLPPSAGVGICAALLLLAVLAAVFARRYFARTLRRLHTRMRRLQTRLSLRARCKMLFCCMYGLTFVGSHLLAPAPL